MNTKEQGQAMAEATILLLLLSLFFLLSSWLFRQIERAQQLQFQVASELFSAVHQTPDLIPNRPDVQWAQLIKGPLSEKWQTTYQDLSIGEMRVAQARKTRPFEAFMGVELGRAQLSRGAAWLVGAGQASSAVDARQRLQDSSSLWASAAIPSSRLVARLKPFFQAQSSFWRHAEPTSDW